MNNKFINEYRFVPVTSMKDRSLEAVAAFLFLLMWLVCILSYLKAPERIPTSFDLLGNVTGYGAKYFYFIFSGIGTLVFALLVWASYYPALVNLPVSLNPKQLTTQYILMAKCVRVCNIIIMALWIVILLQMAAQQFVWLQTNYKILPILTAVCGLVMIATLGYYTWKVSRLNK